MGEKGEDLKNTGNENVQVMERGDIFFFYRPKVNKEEAHNPDDVQRIYILLRPLSSGEKSVETKQESDYNNDNVGGKGAEEVDIKKQELLRLCIMGKKSLPDPSKKRGSSSRPYWGFVELVTTQIDDVKQALKSKEYDTKTRGHSHTEPARALAEGVYVILKHNPERKGMHVHTHLVYKLEFPPENVKNEAQESLNVERQESFIIQVKNPDQGGSGSGFQGLPSKRRAAFPATMQGRFGHCKYVAADPPDVLNYEGCEFLLIAASDDIDDEELGLEVQTQVENSKDPSCSDLFRTFGEETEIRTRPLFQGTWE